MKQNIRIVVVCLARKTFDYEAAAEIYKNLQSKLNSIENVKWEFISDNSINFKFSVQFSNTPA